MSMNGVNDTELLADLRRVADRVDPVPPLVLQSARAVFGLRRLDEELVDLVRDSAEDRGALVAVRGPGDVRMISFELPPVSVEMQVTENAESCDVVAHVSGIELAAAQVETRSQRRDLDPDDGTLLVDRVPAGLVRMHLTSAEGRCYATSWVRI